MDHILVMRKMRFSPWPSFCGCVRRQQRSAGVLGVCCLTIHPCTMYDMFTNRVPSIPHRGLSFQHGKETRTVLRFRILLTQSDTVKVYEGSPMGSGSITTYIAFSVGSVGMPISVDPVVRSKTKSITGLSRN